RTPPSEPLHARSRRSALALVPPGRKRPNRPRHHPGTRKTRHEAEPAEPAATPIKKHGHTRRKDPAHTSQSPLPCKHRQRAPTSGQTFSPHRERTRPPRRPEPSQGAAKGCPVNPNPPGRPTRRPSSAVAP